MTTVTLSNLTKKLRGLNRQQQHAWSFLLLLSPFVIFNSGAWNQGGFGFLFWHILGYAFVIAAVLGRGYSAAYIGGRKGEIVVSEGPYSVVRNPMFVSTFLGMLGIGLQSGMIVVTLALVGAFLWYFPKQVEREEKFLSEKFGDAYTKYMAEVPRWVPSLNLWNEPEVIAIKPRFLRQTFTDACVFFAPLPVFEILGYLHNYGYLTTFLKL